MSFVLIQYFQLMEHNGMFSVKIETFYCNRAYLELISMIAP